MSRKPKLPKLDPTKLFIYASIFEIKQLVLLEYCLKYLQKNWNHSNYFVFLITSD